MRLPLRSRESCLAFRALFAQPVPESGAKQQISHNQAEVMLWQGARENKGKPRKRKNPLFKKESAKLQREAAYFKQRPEPGRERICKMVCCLGQSRICDQHVSIVRLGSSWKREPCLFLYRAYILARKTRMRETQ